MSSKKSYEGQTGRGDVINFQPEALKVVTDPKHPLYDPRVERAPDEAMVLSVMRLGVLEPLLITKDGKENVFVLAGRQRRSAAIEANKRLVKLGQPEIAVPCVWKRGDDGQLFEISVSENEVRSGDSFIERAKKMQRLIDFGRDEGQVAVVFGCTVATVKGSLALLECAPAVKKAVEAGQIAATVATKLSKMSREEQETTLTKMLAEGTTKGVAATKAASKEGTKAAKPALSVKVRDRVFTALTNGAAKDLDTFGKGIAKVVAATLAFVGGEAKALDAWPEVSAIVVEAMLAKPAPKVKKEKAPKVKKEKAPKATKAKKTKTAQAQAEA